MSIHLLLDFSGGWGFTKSRLWDTNAFLLFSRNCDDKIVSAPLVVTLDTKVYLIFNIALDYTLPGQ